MKMKRYARMCMATMLMMIVLLTTVSANGDVQEWGNLSVGNNRYQFMNFVSVRNSSFFCETFIGLTSGSVSAGHLGAQARGFEDGVLRWIGSWNYNTYTSVSSTVGGMPVYGRTYVSRGFIKVWNGSTYNQYEPTQAGPVLSVYVSSVNGIVAENYEIIQPPCTKVQGMVERLEVVFRLKPVKKDALKGSDELKLIPVF